jgi:hypothetical protein
MKSNYFFENKEGYLNITLSGDYDFDDFKTYVKIIYAKCELEGIFKMNMNCMDIEGIDVPTIERYFLGVEAAEQLNYKVKLSLVWHKEYLNHFGETVANNRGAQVGVFGNTESAIKWLLYNIREEEE